MGEMISEFVALNPLTGEIRDKFKLYDLRTKELQAAKKVFKIDCLEIHFDNVFDEFIINSQMWKTTLGAQLCALYKKRLVSFVKFIADMEDVMEKKINNLDDVRIAMDALDRIREESVT